MSICPQITRQRLIVEGIYTDPSSLEASDVRAILTGLTRQLGMTPIAETLIFSPDAVSKLHHGIGGFQPWVESGCSLYTWDRPRLFTLDVYSCKTFSNSRCLGLVERMLAPSQMEWRLA